MCFRLSRLFARVRCTASYEYISGNFISRFLLSVYIHPGVHFKTTDKKIVQKQEFLVINFAGAAIGDHDNFLFNCLRNVLFDKRRLWTQIENYNASTLWQMARTCTYVFGYWRDKIYCGRFINRRNSVIKKIVSDCRNKTDATNSNTLFLRQSM